MSPGNQRCLEVFVGVSRCRISEIIIGWNEVDKKRYLETVDIKEFRKQARFLGEMKRNQKSRVFKFTK